MKRVAILTFSRQALFELGCATELFALPRPDIENWYQTDIVSFESDPLLATGGILLQSQHVTHLDGYDMLVIPSWSSQPREISPELKSAIMKLHYQGKRLLTFCSGAFLLAELGLLRGRKATTHWMYKAAFQSRFPDCEYVDDVLYQYDGEIGCSAGSSAAIDLGIEVIRQDYGHDIANKVARRLVLAAHRSGGQSQYVDKPVHRGRNLFSETLDWAIANLDQKLDIDTLAQQASMSRRTFDRKFRATFNMSANAWLIEQRVALAKQLLEETQHNIERVAQFAGFDNAMTLRHHFRNLVNITPTRYREQFKVNQQSEKDLQKSA
ncbi:helix-turn-helix domain-containing protein [Planctobacterium marinum]|uniref:helix-turn-helix domain-containing protein n=1 Tax=Planctobacterium marinum TaxID=1631968 RepID=UPI001E30F583|nr:helix-turn-helix domain-containing protein [Planctobacterium marinum]MCC2608106.1 helix-turn-helix domain-containing protein [Planctobacterium marinum]